MNEHEKTNYRGAQAMIGRLSGKKIAIPNVNVPPMPSLAAPGVIHNGEKAEDFGEIGVWEQNERLQSWERYVGEDWGVHQAGRCSR